MKNNLLFLFLILQCFYTYAQRNEWINHSSQAIYNTFAPVAVDPVGNSYTLIGTDSLGAIIGQDTFPCHLPRRQGVLVSKFDSSGNLIWGNMINPGIGLITGEKIAVDDAGAVYATLHFPNGGAIYLNDTNFLPSSTGPRGMIVKLDSSGHFLRSISFDSCQAPRISCLGTDLYVSFLYTIAKLDSALNIVWSITDATHSLKFEAATYSGTDIFVQSNGELVATSFKNTNLIGPVLFGNDTVHFTAAGNKEVAVIRLDTSGNILMTKAILLSTFIQIDPSGVCVDHLGNTYLGVNNIQSQLIFGNDTVSPFFRDSFILKWNNSGIPMNVIQFYTSTSSPFGSSPPTIKCLAVNAQNELLVSGITGQALAGTAWMGIANDTLVLADDNAFLLKFDIGRTLAWYKSFTYDASADGIAVKNGNQYILAGSVRHSTNIALGCLQYASAIPSNFITMISELQELIPVLSYTFIQDNDSTYMFFNNSVGATSWLWDFGDNTTSTDQNVVHVFPNGGPYNVYVYAFHGGCGVAGIFAILGVGLKEINSSESFSIFPNPAKEIIRIKTSNKMESAELKIYNALGIPFDFKIDNSSLGNTEKVIHLKNISPGIYFARMQDGTKQYAQKFIIQ